MEVHNFLSEKTTLKLGCALKMIEGTKVKVANGEELQCKYKCEGSKWSLQGHKFSTNVYLLRFDHYDLILRTQWLIALGGYFIKL